MKTHGLIKTVKSLPYKIFRTVLLIGMCYLFMFPVLYIVSLAVRDPATANDPSIIWLPKEMSLKSISKAFELMEYRPI